MVDHSVLDAFWAALFGALFLGLGWILNRGFSRMDKRHRQAEQKFDDIDENTANIRHHTQLPPWRTRHTDDES